MSAEDSDEARRLRSEDRDQDDEFGRVTDADGDAGERRVGSIATNGSFPTRSDAFFAVKCQRLFGEEVEGQAGTFEDDSEVILALNVGGGIPDIGTKVEITYVPYRWTFRHG